MDFKEVQRINQMAISLQKHNFASSSEEAVTQAKSFVLESDPSPEPMEKKEDHVEFSTEADTLFAEVEKQSAEYEGESMPQEIVEHSEVEEDWEDLLTHLDQEMIRTNTELRNQVVEEKPSEVSSQELGLPQ